MFPLSAAEVPDEGATPLGECLDESRLDAKKESFAGSIKTIDTVAKDLEYTIEAI